MIPALVAIVNAPQVLLSVKSTIIFKKKAIVTVYNKILLESNLLIPDLNFIFIYMINKKIDNLFNL
jgi:hypothetical protein